MSASVYGDFLNQRLNVRAEQNALRKLLPANADLIDFSSNDYLGLSRSHELHDIIAAEYELVMKSGEFRWNGSAGSRLLNGDSAVAHLTEKFLADFFRSESALIFNSGYTANVALMSALPSRTSTVLYDEKIHASVRDGIRMNGCRAWSFRHNDLTHLEELLSKSTNEIWVVVESVYSMDGDSPDAKQLTELCERYNAALIVDEAHSGGIYGEQGKGWCVENEIENRVFARLFTFGKAYGVHGAAVCGSETLRTYLVNFARPFIYSTTLPVRDVIAIREAVKFASACDSERSQLSGLIDYFRALHKTSSCAYSITDSHSPVQGVIVPGNSKVRELSKQCLRESIDVRAVLAPTVEPGVERLRVILHSFNTKAEVDRLMNVLIKSDADHR
ncbi:MAG: aminotransferase class I/II-fold pyridoxal phosphate-dependent enzyme [Bacteroidia bacterium]|nr:aminotransferase class I/II-fold pyridoxal phosphate-dependent enzyme [Bacteroidia bacterium]